MFGRLGCIFVGLSVLGGNLGAQSAGLPDRALLEDLRPFFFESSQAEEIGRLNSEQINYIYRQSFEFRAQLYEENKRAHWFSTGGAELLRPSVFIKSAALLFFILPKKKIPLCPKKLKEISSKPWIRRISLAGLGLWLGSDIVDAYSFDDRNFQLEWLRQYENQRRVAESREEKLAAEIAEIQSRALREEMANALPPSHDFLWIPADFSLDQMGQAFARQTYVIVFQKDNLQAAPLALRFRFHKDLDRGAAHWKLDHAAWLSEERLKEIHLDPSKISSSFFGELDRRRFWSLIE